MKPRGTLPGNYGFIMQPASELAAGLNGTNPYAASSLPSDVKVLVFGYISAHVRKEEVSATQFPAIL